MGPHRGGRVLLTGAGGQLAADLAATFTAAGHEVHARRREDLDIADERAVRLALDDVRPSVILNAAAYNRVDDAETDAPLAFAVNAYGPRVLARASADAGATLVHYSTDYVVDGARRRPYTEADAPLPLSAYATSKLCGEYFVRALAPRHYVLRVFADQIVAPTAAHDVAVATLALVAGAAPYDLYHCTASGETSWYDYARAIFDIAGVTADLSPTTAAAYGAPARRPAYSILDNAKLAATGVPRPRHWREALVEYISSH